MALYTVAFVLTLLCALTPSHLALVGPNLNPFYYPQPEQGRIFTIDLNEYSSVQQRTTTTVVSTTVTYATVVTCTKSVSPSCDPEDAATTNRAPFPTGIARSLKEFRELEDVQPSKVISVEPTEVPKVAREAHPYYEPFVYGSYEPMYQLDSSIARELSPDQSRALFSFTTTTLTLTSYFSTTSVSTRTLIPGCSTSGYFTQCP